MERALLNTDGIEPRAALEGGGAPNLPAASSFQQTAKALHPSPSHPHQCFSFLFTRPKKGGLKDQAGMIYFWKCPQKNESRNGQERGTTAQSLGFLGLNFDRNCCFPDTNCKTGKKIAKLDVGVCTQKKSLCLFAITESVKLVF